MQESFSVNKYVAYLFGRWRFIAIACASAALIAGAVTLTMPKRYTATARIVIEPAAGSDARAPQVITPQYLEMLKSYVEFASNDSLFQKAMEKFRLRDEPARRAVEDWKSEVLAVGLIGNTKVLEIGVTLTDPAKAQAMAQYLAEQTIELSQSMRRAGDENLIEAAKSRRDLAWGEYEKAEASWARVMRDDLVEELISRAEALELRRARVELTLADMQAKSGDAVEAAAARERLEKEKLSLQESIERTRREVTQRFTRREGVGYQRDDSRARFENAQKQLDDTRGAAGYRGERLQMIDAGIVPEKPSSPSLRLNVMAAILFALAVSLGVATLQFNLRQSRDE
jgi:uncharacterized protein involved in exopolysaccharide biosynthesis